MPTAKDKPKPVKFVGFKPTYSRPQGQEKDKSKPRLGQKAKIAHEVLTLAEAAAWLRLEEPVVERLARGGELPGRCAEGEWRFLRAALADWLAGHDSISKPMSSKEKMLAVVGVWKDDPSVDAMVDEIYRKRKANSVGVE